MALRADRLSAGKRLRRAGDRFFARALIALVVA
jgi:hypothetical protein